MFKRLLQQRVLKGLTHETIQQAKMFHVEHGNVVTTD